MCRGIRSLVLLCAMLVIFARYVEGESFLSEELLIEVEVRKYPEITVTSGSASNILVEVSQDLETWVPLVNVYTTTASGFYRDLDTSVGQQRYYRARTPGIASEEMQSVWESKGIEEYTAAFKRICFCFPHDTLSGTISVVNGNVQDVTDVKGEAGVPVDDPNLGEFKSIEELFAIIENEIGDADAVNVEYHAEDGYPVRIRIDQIVEVADDGTTYEVSDVVYNSNM